jgi:hypothetical protein
MILRFEFILYIPCHVKKAFLTILFESVVTIAFQSVFHSKTH